VAFPPVAGNELNRTTAKEGLGGKVGGPGKGDNSATGRLPRGAGVRRGGPESKKKVITGGGGMVVTSKPAIGKSHSGEGAEPAAKGKGL